MTDASRNLAALRASHERLASLVEPLDGDGLRSPSYDSEWTIGQVLSHLGSQTEIMSRYLDAAIDGGDGPGRDDFPAVWDAWNAMSPEEHRGRCLAANATQLDRLDALTPEQAARLHFSLFGVFEVDTAGFVRLRLGEHAVHTWDIAVALRPDATVAPGAVEILIDGSPELAGIVGRPQGLPFTLRIDTEAPQRSFALVVVDTVVLEPFDEQPVDGTLRLPAEALLRLIGGRLDPAHTPAVELDAGALTLDDLRAVFPGF